MSIKDRAAIESFTRKMPYLEARTTLTKSIRTFFDNADFTEVETPILQVMAGADVHIHGFKTTQIDHLRQPVCDLYLQTSPEFEMKKLLVAGMPRIFQLCKTFRNGEGSKLHSAEFTMLEWYRADADYHAMMADCEALLKACATALDITHYKHADKTADPYALWHYISVADAFTQYANIDLEACLDDRNALAAAAQTQNIRVIQTDAWDDIFHAIMAEKIEPHLGQGAPTILKDYPISMACLARKKPSDPRFAERFELYVFGIELANAFSELTDPAEQRARFEADMALKESLYGERYPLDESFLSALQHGMPESAGIALGIDRLAMLASGADDIKDVLWSA
jgi:lysyl-tRNA synthetase class 2